MTLRNRLELRQGQGLVMTPQLQRSIKLLPLSNLELFDVVTEELRNNLLLASPGEGALAPAYDESETAQSADSDSETAGYDDGETDAEDYGESAPADHAAAGPGDWDGRSGSAAASDDGISRLEQTLTRPETLRSYLVDQLTLEIADPIDRLIGLHLIDSLDSSGYYTDDPADAATRLACDPARIEAVLATLRRFDPTGLFARDLADCLALQLAERDRLDPAMVALLDNLGALAAGDFAKLESLCGVDREDLSEMIGEIKALNPKPAQLFEAEIAQTIVPDVFLRQDPGGA